MNHLYAIGYFLLPFFHFHNFFVDLFLFFAHKKKKRDYVPGSEDAIKLKAACEKMRRECPDIPCVVGGKEVRLSRLSHFENNSKPTINFCTKKKIRSGDVKKQLIPSDNKHVLCTFHQANKDILQQAIDASLAAKEKWVLNFQKISFLNS